MGVDGGTVAGAAKVKSAKGSRETGMERQPQISRERSTVRRERSMKNDVAVHELARAASFPHMRARKSADGAVANLVRSGRKQPQRIRAGSSASTARTPAQRRARNDS